MQAAMAGSCASSNFPSKSSTPAAVPASPTHQDCAGLAIPVAVFPRNRVPFIYRRSRSTRRRLTPKECSPNGWRPGSRKYLPKNHESEDRERETRMGETNV